MKKYSYLLTIVVIFNYFIQKILAENNYYVISIKRNEKDKEYDKASENVKDAIDELVNDRMNDIYDIINDNKNSYVNEKGIIDEKLDELIDVSYLKKRHSEKVKLRFINNNRPERNKRQFRKRSDDIYEYIPFKSDLVVHICPVSNYYVIIAYLSEDIINEIKKLPNIINCTIYKELEGFSSISDKVKSDRKKALASEYYQKYYNETEILKETQWRGLDVQEKNDDISLFNEFLSPLSQGINVNNKTDYDNNYYYPSSAGKGIDIFVIDDGFNALFNEETIEDFNTYEGTDDERIIRCEGEFYNGEYHPPHNYKQCGIGKISESITHGTTVSIAAVGTIHGSAKKANLHVISSKLDSYTVLAALDYIKQYGTPYKTVINLSIGCTKKAKDEQCQDQPLQDKILELVESNIVIIAAAGNESRDRCNILMFEGAKGVITVGALDSKAIDYKHSNHMYKPASYSNYGECVVGFAPGTLRTPYLNSITNGRGVHGTSISAPLVSGVVATIMSDDQETNYNYYTMKKKLIDLSVEGVIENINDKTPNRIINNGKKSIYVKPIFNNPLLNLMVNVMQSMMSIMIVADHMKIISIIWNMITGN